MSGKRTNIPTLCPADYTLGIIGGKWKSTIICKLHQHGPMRYNTLLREVNPISSRILSKQLRELEADGIVSRSEEPPNVIYAITERGETLGPVLEALRNWAVAHHVPDMVRFEECENRNDGSPGE
ncbi:MAG: helix-turn-helix transcriptional regulator [Thermoplasmatales archaeon]|nr:helix-turn-helix transcriptional regulator [Thermoplasmatales archaeon]